MKILLLAQFLPPRKFGGEERHIWTLARGLAARQHDVTLLGFNTGEDGPSESVMESVRIVRVKTAASRLPLIYTDSALPYAMPLPDPLVRQAITQELAGGGYDVIHAHNWIVNSAISPATRAHVPLVMTLHDYSHVCATKRLMELDKRVCPGPSPRRCIPCSVAYYGPLKGAVTLAANTWSSRRRAKAVTNFAAVSGAVAQGVSLSGNGAWQRVSGAAIDAEVIPNFIPDEIVLDDVETVASDAPLVFAGDIQPDKGVHTLLKAYRLLDNPPPLVLAGRRTPTTPGFVFEDGEADSSDKPPTADVDAWRIPKGVEFRGALPNEEVLTLFRSARVVMVPSVFADPCPTVVLEAMAAGRPVVGAASGGIGELIVDNVTGLLFPPGDPHALAKAITTLLQDPSTADRFGVAGRDRARDFTATAIVERLERMYLGAIAEAEGKVGRAL